MVVPSACTANLSMGICGLGPCLSSVWIGLIAFFKFTDWTVWLYCMRLRDAAFGLDELSMDSFGLGPVFKFMFGLCVLILFKNAVYDWFYPFSAWILFLVRFVLAFPIIWKSEPKFKFASWLILFWDMVFNFCYFGWLFYVDYGCWAVDFLNDDLEFTFVSPADWVLAYPYFLACCWLRRLYLSFCYLSALVSNFFGCCCSSGPLPIAEWTLFLRLPKSPGFPLSYSFWTRWDPTLGWKFLSRLVRTLFIVGLFFDAPLSVDSSCFCSKNCLPLIFWSGPMVLNRSVEPVSP